MECISPHIIHLFFNLGLQKVEILSHHHLLSYQKYDQRSHQRIQIQNGNLNIPLILRFWHMPTFPSLSTSSQEKELEVKTKKALLLFRTKAMASKLKTFWAKKSLEPSTASRESPFQGKKKRKVFQFFVSIYLKDVLTLIGTSLENLSLTCALIH